MISKAIKSLRAGWVVCGVQTCEQVLCRRWNRTSTFFWNLSYFLTFVMLFFICFSSSLSNQASEVDGVVMDDPDPVDGTLKILAELVKR